MSVKKQPKLLYIHGFEGGPNGLKPQTLSKSFNVHCIDQKAGIWKPFNKNSVIRNLIKLQFNKFLSIISTMIGTYFYYNKNNKKYQYIIPSLIGISYISYFIFNKNKIIANSLQNTLNICVKNQTKIVKNMNNDNDIIVASSFGGAVALEIIKNGDWKGKIVLLAPGYLKIDSYLNNYDYQLSKNAYLKKKAAKLNIVDMKYKILIIHGCSDTAVLLEDSQLMESENSEFIELKTLENDGNRIYDHNLFELCKSYNGNEPQLITFIKKYTSI